jgi:WD40 repeat protein/serine/threonine protein kinase
MLAPDTRLKDRYRILHNVGGGGFGYVYKAMDEVFGCSVAIKETREEVANRDKLRKAFEREAKLLRNLKHDSLARVTDYFFQGRAQFLVMDFIEGEDLAALLKKRLQQHQGPFTCQELLPWIDKILAALEYLHSRPEPIIHRDIKPSNIKLADDGEVYLLDFGLAKGATGQMSTVVEGQTSSSVPGFTREYAPLEQVQDTGTEPQSDIYALGATLYHLLTAQLPILASLRDEALQRGQSDPLRPAHEVNPAIPLVVSQVISQALAVRWWDRIASATEMRAALERACGGMAATKPRPAAQSASQSLPLDSEDAHATLSLPQPGKKASPDKIKPAPPLAKTPTRWHGLRRSWLIGGLALVLLMSLAIAVRLAFPHWFAPAVSMRPDAQAAQPSENLKPPIVATPADLRLKQTLIGHTGSVWSVAFSPDGSLAASASEDATIVLWDTKTWKLKFKLTGHTGAVYSVAFSPDGNTLASGSSDKTIRLWDTQTGQLREPLLREHTKSVRRLAFSPNGDFLASCSGEQLSGDKEIRLWNVHNGWKSKILEGHEEAVRALAFSPDTQSSVLASTGYDNTLRLWNPGSNEPSVVLRKYNDLLSAALAFSADGNYLACGSSDTTIKLWVYQPQAQRWQELEPLKGHKGFITSVAFSPDNQTMVSASADGSIRLWDLADKSSIPFSLDQGEIRAPQTKERPKNTFNSVAVAPDGRTLLTGGQDTTVRVWQ